MYHIILRYSKLLSLCTRQRDVLSRTYCCVGKLPSECFGLIYSSIYNVVDIVMEPHFFIVGNIIVYYTEISFYQWADTQYFSNSSLRSLTAVLSILFYKNYYLALLSEWKRRRNSIYVHGTHEKKRIIKTQMMVYMQWLFDAHIIK